MRRAKALSPAREKERLDAIERIHAASPDLDPVLQEIADKVRALFGTRLCLINIVLKDAVFVRAWSCEQPLTGDRTLPLEQSICPLVVERARPLCVPDVSCAEDEEIRARAPQLRGYAGAPVMTRRGLALGVLCLLDHAPLELTAKDLTLLEAYADAAAARLELLGAVQHLRTAYSWMGRSARDMFVIVTADGMLVEANEAAYQTTGYTPADLAGRRVIDLVYPDDRPVVTQMVENMLRQGPGGSHIHRLIRKDGEPVWVEWYPTCVFETDTLYLCGRDITSRRKSEAALWKAAHYDPLTGLPNRMHFTELLEGVITRRSACEEPVAVLFVDLDDFKLVNDSIGHEVGDRLLQDAAARLEACVGSREHVCRLGGDEFLVLADGVQVTAAPEVLAREILATLHRPFLIDGHQVYTQASIGVAVTSQPISAGELMRQADVAMYSAKQVGKGTFQVFDPGMMRQVVQRLNLATDLRRAEEQAEFRVFYQPVVALGSGQVVGAEALIRWCPPGRPAVSPADFIPVAETTGMILSIGTWVLQQACRQAKAWLEAGRPTWVSINLSPRQFQDADLVEKVAAALAEAALPPHLLKLEITETALIQDVALAAATLRELSRLGIRIGIDDFGTGYSSLSYLREFPVNFLKIDQSFIRQVESDPTGREMVHVVVMLAKALSLDVVAEGVETGGQADLLRQMNCGLAQGYFFQRPVPAEEFRW